MPPKYKFTKDQIVDTGFQLVRTHGWNGLTARSLASALGTSAKPIYSYFPSIASLEELVVKKAVDLLYSMMTRQYTEDPWHDHGIGYALFGLEEKRLFAAVNHENRIVHFRKYGDLIWNTLTRSLSDYPPFAPLSEDQIYQIQLSRWLFAHGLAFQASAAPAGTWNRETIIMLMVQNSRALLNGLKLEFTQKS